MLLYFLKISFWRCDHQLNILNTLTSSLFKDSVSSKYYIFQDLNKICQRTRVKNMNLAILHRSLSRIINMSYDEIEQLRL